MKEHDNHHCKEPMKRTKPPYCGKVDTASMGEYYSARVEHHCHPHCGYEIPPLKPLFVPGMSPQEQTQLIASRVDELTKMLGEYNEKVWGAYEEIVNSAICNDAYYSEIVTETGYLTETSAKYTVVHIPFIDRAGEPIYLQLGLAYDNTTNSGLKESVFDASERKIADKLIPAFNIGDKWNGKARWCGAPIQSEEGTITLGVSKNGFLKIYNNTATDADMNKDDIFYSMGVQSALISGGKVVQSGTDTSNQNIGRVGIGMNYDTQERFFILVDGYGATGVEGGGGCTSNQLAELFAKYGCTVAVEVANGDSTCMLDKGELVNIPYESGVTRTTSDTEGGKIPYVPKVNCFWYITKKRHYHNDYVREVGELMQKYGRSIWQGIVDEKAVNALKEEVQNVYVELDKEITNRKDADEVLQGNIDSLGERVTNLYNELVTSDMNLDAKITKLREDLTIETQERKDADEALEQGVGQAKNLIEQEKTDRQSADELLQRNITEEASNRMNADSELEERLNQRIENEASERKSADKTLNEEIDTEIADRKTADTELESRLNESVNNEATARKNADNELTNKINDEITDRTQADTELESRVNLKINEETSARESADNDINTSLTKLKDDYESFKTTTNADLSTKKQQIDNILADINTVKTQITDLQNGQSAINETFTTIMSTLSTMEQSFENLKQTVANLQTSWEDYKTNWESEWTAYKKSIEDAFEAFKDAVNASLKAYVPLAGTEGDAFVTGMIVAKGTAQENNVGLEVGATDSDVDTKVQANKITLYNGISGSQGVAISHSSDPVNNDMLVISTANSFDAVHVNNVAEPIYPLDVANKKYVDNKIGMYVPLTGTEDNRPVTGQIKYEVNNIVSNFGESVGVEKDSSESDTAIKTSTLLDGETLTLGYYSSKPGVTTDVKLKLGVTFDDEYIFNIGKYDEHSGYTIPVRITGVNTGTKDNDAVNVNQLNEAKALIPSLETTVLTFGDLVGTVLAAGNSTAWRNSQLSSNVVSILPRYFQSGNPFVNIEYRLYITSDGLNIISFRMTNNGGSEYTIREQDGILVNYLV